MQITVFLNITHKTELNTPWLKIFTCHTPKEICHFMQSLKRKLQFMGQCLNWTLQSVQIIWCSRDRSVYCFPSIIGTQGRMNEDDRITKYMHITLLLDTTPVSQTSFMSDFVHLWCRLVEWCFQHTVSTKLLPPYLSTCNNFFWHAHDTVKINIQFSLYTQQMHLGESRYS